MMKKIIFICKYNIFRSRVAEEYFKKINKNKNISVASRGFIMGGGKADEVQKKIAKKYGLNIIDKPKSVSLEELIASDLIIVVADDIPKIMFNYKLDALTGKLQIWKIPDEQNGNAKNVEKIIKRIIKNVERLIGELK